VARYAPRILCILLIMCAFALILRNPSASESLPVDTTIEIPPRHYSSVNFTVSQDNILVRVEINVTNGSGLDVLLCDEENMDLFERQIKMGYYDVDVYMAGSNITKLSNETRLGRAGVYYLVLINWDFQTSSIVNIKISKIGEKSGLAITYVMSIVSIVAVVVIIWFLVKIKKL